ncbi:hypothetical protein BDP27DRAFT_223530 [Rhodocollybia butyracea]|uniref:Secreted protein n=1 Tax=Rhodocollybia butyracea TaxID=206335 RepID=A0A9P5PXA5_9AGAR|nr:hypothetical protein BDP27DRAFT_223530 [Rhodocollybia butyracea]
MSLSLFCLLGAYRLRSAAKAFASLTFDSPTKKSAMKKTLNVACLSRGRRRQGRRIQHATTKQIFRSRTRSSTKAFCWRGLEEETALRYGGEDRCGGC